MAMQKPDSTWFVFLALTFAVVGMTGMFATFAAPIAMQRAVLRDEALDAARLALKSANPAAALEALRPRLDDSAAALLPIGGDMEARIAAERLAMHARLQIDHDATALRLRWLMAVITLGSAGFGMAILASAGRSKTDRT
jgi:hypothetical protein